MEDKINILLVDDRPENLLSIEAIIEKDEYRLVKASSGEEALKYLLKYQFALILMDVHMPGMDGFTTAKIIKAREKTKHIPILFITANNMESEHIFMGYAVGAVDYILKPIDPLILKAKVERFVDIYKMKQNLVRKNEALEEKTQELEKANRDLLETTSKLRVLESLTDVVFETSKDAMFILDPDGNIVKCNPSSLSMFQYDKAELLGKPITTLFTQHEAKQFIKDNLTFILQYGHVKNYENQKEVPVTGKNGRTLIGNVHIGFKNIDDRSVIACTIQDLTSQKKNEELITHMAYHDYLTELPNRRMFRKQLPTMLQQAKQSNGALSLLFLDMDGFKYINESLGHLIGDQVLKAAAKALQQIVRKNDFIARLGGDEFVILLPNTDRETSLEIAERILDRFQQPFTIDYYDLYITTSIGLSVFPYDGEDDDELMKNAFAALYTAKQQGKNHYRVYHNGMNLKFYQKFLLKNDLHKAIARNEFAFRYHPSVNTKSGKAETIEVKLTWNHPKWGEISPEELQSLTDESGLVTMIGDWVIQTVCKQLKIWREKGDIPVSIALNLSPKQLLEKNFIEKLKKVLQETKVKPAQLQFEFLENELKEYWELVKIPMQELKELGVKLCIDDFGIGYSGLQFLHLLPVDKIKIHPSFSRMAGTEKDAYTLLLAAYIAIAEQSDLSIIATGVETTEQFQFFGNNGCNEVQGPIVSSPLSRKEVEALLFQGEMQFFKEWESLSSSSQKPSKEEKQENLIRSSLFELKETFSLSTRELEVLELILNGLSNKEISQQLYISEHTVKNHIYHIFQKMDVTDRSQAMAIVFNMLKQG